MAGQGILIAQPSVEDNDAAPASAELDNVLAQYPCRGYSSVRAFLSRQPYLLETLAQTRTAIETWFGPDTPIILEATNDPDGSETSNELFVFIRTSADPEAALSTLDRFDREYWIGASRASRHKMNVTLEFV